MLLSIDNFMAYLLEKKRRKKTRTVGIDITVTHSEFMIDICLLFFFRTIQKPGRDEK